MEVERYIDAFLIGKFIWQLYFAAGIERPVSIGRRLRRPVERGPRGVGQVFRIAVIVFRDEDFMVFLPSADIVRIAEGYFYLARLCRSGVKLRRDEIARGLAVGFRIRAIPLLIACGLRVGRTLAPRLFWRDGTELPSSVEVAAGVIE